MNWPDDVPADLADVLTACNHLTGGPVDRDEILNRFLLRLDTRYGELLEPGGRTSLVDAWRSRSATLGRRVRVDLSTDDVEGTAVDVDG